MKKKILMHILSNGLWLAPLVSYTASDGKVFKEHINMTTISLMSSGKTLKQSVQIQCDDMYDKFYKYEHKLRMKELKENE